MKVLEKTPRPSLRVKRGRPNKKTKNLFVLKFSKNTALTMSPPLPLSLLPSLWLCKGYVSRGARCVAFLLVLRSYVKERRLGEELCGVWVRWWLFLGCLRPIKLFHLTFTSSGNSPYQHPCEHDLHFKFIFRLNK